MRPSWCTTRVRGRCKLRIDALHEAEPFVVLIGNEQPFQIKNKTSNEERLQISHEEQGLKNLCARLQENTRGTKVAQQSKVGIAGRR